jgi:D-altritol 5-dehydrogenase
MNVSGAGVTSVTLGARVVIDPNLHCVRCDPCRRGLFHRCERLGAHGVSSHGGIAEACVVRAADVLPIGDLDFATAALAEPLGCVLNGIGAIGIACV